MAIVAVAADLFDLRRRLGAITIGQTRDGEPVTAEQIGAAGSMAVLLKETIKPNLVQTLEGQPAFVHCGPFANIAHGNNSLVADRVALKLADYVVTESGFASDMGMEKFMDIVCRLGNIRPDAVVLVATVKALKHHAGDPDGGLDAIETGAANMLRHIGIVREFGLNPVVAVNRFPDDTDESVELVKKLALEGGAYGCEVNDGFSQGGAGAAALAEIVTAAADEKTDFRLHLSARRDDRGQDRRDRKARLRSRRDLPSAGRTCKGQGVQQARLRPAADLHGEDASLAVPRPEAGERAGGVHGRRPRPPRLHGRRLDRRALRRHADHARLRQDAGGNERRHRRTG